MRLSLLPLLFSALFLSPHPPAPTTPIPPPVSPQASLQDRLTGAWRLVSVETIKPDGSIIYPFYGKHPEGLIVYDRSGWMSVQIVSDPKPDLPKADSRQGFLDATAAEKAAAADGYYAYYGTWSVDAAKSTVTHHLTQSLYPGERGTNFVRQVTFRGNQLILEAKTHEMNEDHIRKLTWQRLP